jgi:hypothetical protein
VGQPVTVGAGLVLGGVALLIVGLSLFLGYRVYRTRYVPWKPIPNYYPGSRYFVRPGVTLDPKALAAALHAAESFLIERTQWNAGQMVVVGARVYVYVMDAETWTDLWGREVAGMLDGEVLVVGPSLAALCHEMAHLCEKVLSPPVDDYHGSWKVNGVQLAVDEFETWTSTREASHIAAGVVSGVVSTAPRLSGMESCRYRRP